MRVLKFGGSSLATPDRIRAVVRIVLHEARHEPLIVVVSAFQGVTNQLIDSAQRAERGDSGGEHAWAAIAERHRSAIDALLGPRRGRRTRVRADALLGELHDALHGIRLLGHCPPRALDVVASFGERLSALIVAAYVERFRPSRFA